MRTSRIAVVAVLVSLGLGCCSGDKIPEPAPSRAGVAIAVVVDTSASMTPYRRSAAFRALGTLFDNIVKLSSLHPKLEVEVGVYSFASRVETVRSMAPVDRADLASALRRIPESAGLTAIGDAMLVAGRALAASGLRRRHMIVITDGENSWGSDPKDVIAQVTERRITAHFVAFQTEAGTFDFVRDAGGLLLSASDGESLQASLETIYTQKILVEAPE